MANLQNAGLFGTETRSSVLLAIHMLNETYPTQVARTLGISLNQAQKAIDSLERAGVVVGEVEGRQRRVRLNPRYALAAEWDTVERDGMMLHVLSPTDCVRDRLFWFIQTRPDYSALDQALAVAVRHPIDLGVVERWFESEGEVGGVDVA